MQMQTAVTMNLDARTLRGSVIVRALGKPDLSLSSIILPVFAVSAQKGRDSLLLAF